MTNYNGAFTDYGDAPKSRTFFRASGKATQTKSFKEGYVIKKGTFLQSAANGKVIPHLGCKEKNSVTFANITSGQTLIIAGLTFTASAACPKADLVTAFSGLAVGTTAAQANAQNPVTTGSFTAGTLAGYSTTLDSDADSVLFISTSPYADVTDLSASGTATAPTITNIPYSAEKIAGVTMMDVDASSTSVDAEVYIEASFWADAVIWDVDVATDTITLFDGTTKAVTAYSTGATTDDLKKKFVEGSEFSELGFESAGEAV